MFDMSYMGAYYPVVIGLIGLIYITMIYFVGKKGMFKTAVAMSLFGAFMVIYGPIKIDGTNTKKNHQVTSKQRTAEYVEVTSTRKVVETTKPTFAERMAAEEARSDKATLKTRDEILTK